MMIGALMIHGIAPGPRVMTDRPGLFWGLIASMWLGNLMLVILWRIKLLIILRRQGAAR
jgi:putative tricarboxylic transport membrane protein